MKWHDEIEPVAVKAGELDDPTAILSIAISLKRIADALERAPSRRNPIHDGPHMVPVSWRDDAASDPVNRVFSGQVRRP